MIFNIGYFDCSGSFCHSFENTCDYYWDAMEPLNFYLDGLPEPFSIPPWSYSFSGDNINMPACTVAVSISPIEDQPITILGDSFLRQYVTSFNYTENTITLGVNANHPI